MIVTCGEALIDMVPGTTTDGREAFVPVCGGAALNSAVALGRLGAKVGIVSGISTDLFGDMLVDGLHAATVSTDLLVRSDRPTTLAFVRLTNGNASYTFYDEVSAGRMVQPSDLPGLPNSVEALALGGISLISEPCGSAYEALAQRAAKDCVIYLDPNIRTGFIRDGTAYRARLDRLLAVADIVKVSDEEVDWLEATPQDWLAAGRSVVIVTQGSDGATVYTKTGSIHAVPPKAEVVDTIGAGDTFNAGFLCALSEAGLLDKARLAAAKPDNFRAALTLGNAAAAITVSRAGANPPFRSELAL